MKLRSLKHFIACLFLIPVLMLSCSDEGITIKLMVVSNVKGFSGYYIVNGDTIDYFSATENAYGIAMYEKEIDDVEYLEVSATTKQDATSIEIKVYRDDKKVKSSQTNIEDPFQPTILNLEYSIGEEDEEATAN
ncbi:MAG: hypothetical protein KBG92_12155 [Spirochaetes bacterium]|nr:hypothetical protein [Spirochaetota bacterium]